MVNFSSNLHCMFLNIFEMAILIASHLMKYYFWFRNICICQLVFVIYDINLCRLAPYPPYLVPTLGRGQCFVSTPPSSPIFSNSVKNSVYSRLFFTGELVLGWQQEVARELFFSNFPIFIVMFSFSIFLMAAELMLIFEKFCILSMDHLVESEF